MKIAVLLPCYNESLTIAKVIADFRRELPDAEIWVYDNNSTDGSVDIAKNAGALLRHVPQQGKGFVVRRMFREIDADVYIMVDADDTYPADEVHKLIKPIIEGRADMANGDRLSSTYFEQNKRPGHNFGNTLVCLLILMFWRRRINDVMTGYRAFSRFFVKTCPVLSGGFEIETEMTLHTIDKRMSLIEVPINYRDRPVGSVSKLHTISDGIKVIKTIFNFFRFYRPELFFSIVATVFVVVAGVLFLPVFIEYLRTGLVPRQPTLIVSGFMVLAAFLCVVCGQILGQNKKQFDQLFEIVSANTKNNMAED